MRGWMAAGLVVLAIASPRTDAGDVAGSETDGWSCPPAGVEDVHAADGQAAEHAYLRRTARALAHTDRPRELALAALLHQAAARPAPPAPGDVIDTSVTHTRFDGIARGWRQRAAARAGHDVIADVLLIEGADKIDDISQDAAQRWADAQPDNSAPWLLRTDLPVDALLQAAAQRRHYDSAHFQTLRWMRDALAAHPADARTRASTGDRAPMSERVYATMLALGLYGANTVPGYSRLAGGCRSATPERQVACRSLAGQLLASDTLIMRSIGSAIASRLDAPDVEATRAIAWRTDAMQRATAPDGERQFVRLLDDASIRTEIELQARMLSEAGIPLVPPADWTPPTH
ncbi:MAG: hypothetical protein ACJ8GV_00860 [Luteimonas sp.]